MTSLAKSFFDRYDAGEPPVDVWSFFNGLGTGLYNLVNLFDPQTILIGGGIVERPGFLALLREHRPGLALRNISTPSATATMPGW